MMKIQLIYLVVILFGINHVHSSALSDLGNSTTKDAHIKHESDRQSRFSMENFLSSIKDAVLGVFRSLKSKWPAQEEFFDAQKQVIAGYPLKALSSLANKFCSAALSSDAIAPKYRPDITKMKFQLRTLCQTQHFPILEADKLLSSPDFDSKKKVVIFASGWTTNVNDSDIIDTLAKAHLCRGDINFIAIDSGSFVDTLYSWSALNTDDIGQHIAEGLKKISEVVPLENIHLIGHSLGAHIVGAAARYFNYITGKLIPRVTGLDPARPCFNEGESLSGLQRGDAAYIDVIHTNPGVMGQSYPMGDADFYPSGLTPLPPGCWDASCAHARAWKFYAETVYPENENNFMSRRCSSLTTLRRDKCPGIDYPMGYAVPYNLKGNYFLEVNSKSPFGINGNQQRLLKYNECGVCKEKTN